MKRVDARRVLVPNARVVRTFEGTILGHFSRLGPNSWDPYAFVAREAGAICVRAGLRVQTEQRGAVIRMRFRGSVIRVRWTPMAQDQLARRQSETTPRAFFVAHFLESHSSRPGFGPAAVIASKLSPRRRQR